MQNIRIRGARTHNLKNVDLDLPRDRLIVFTGLSGSGKSSLAFDTIYAEGQRRYVESLSTYARQFLSMMEKPDVDTIEGLSPAISIEQKSTSHNPRSTVGTVTEVYDYLRLLYARAGTPRCPDHHIDLAAQTVSQMVDAVLAHPEGTAMMLLAPAISERKGEHAELLEELQAGGFVRARIDGKVVELDQAPKLDVRRKHTVEAIVDRFRVRPDLSQRLAESFETALRLGAGVARVAFMDDPDRAELVFSNKFACPICNYSLTELEPRLFSFNSPIGACPTCDGLGTQDFFDPGKIVANPHLSLAGGAVRGWDRRNAYYFQVIQSLARHAKFDIEAPYESLSQKIQDLVLFGSDDEQIEFKYLDGKGGTVKRRHAFEGIVKNLERRYRETESATVREELAKYRSSRACPDCGGTRLNRAARNVFVENRSLPEVSALSVAHALDVFHALKLPGWRGEVAVKIVKEIGDRLAFWRTWASAISPSIAAPRLSRAVKRSASDWPARSAPAWWASCTFWTNPPSDCTSATTSGCSTPWSICATSAIPSSSSSTMRMRSGRPIMWWTSVPARACMGDGSWRRARRQKSPRIPSRSPENS